jgi:hypothetical protein
LHPKFKPNQFERSHHIICFHFTQPTTRILAEELKPLVNDLSKRFDIPVSLYCDDQSLSIALFWDIRAFGSLKMLDFESHLAFKQLNLDQFLKVSLETSFDMDQLLNKEKFEPLASFPSLLLQGSRIKIQS